MATASDASYQTNVYYGANIKIKSGDGMVFEPVDLIGAVTAHQNIGILLGRDFLSIGYLGYDGPNGKFTFTTN